MILAKHEALAVGLGAGLVLNALALSAFLPIGHARHMSQNQCGRWCAIAIHDTSLVVGAAAAYGNQAPEVATTAQLARALWISPVAIGTALVFKQKGVKIKIPYFISGLILANTFVPAAKPLGPVLVGLAKIGLTVTHFFIGAAPKGRFCRAARAGS